MDRDKELLSKEQLMAVFRERLTTAIKDKKLNFNKLAQMVGISASAMYQYTHEKNGTLPSMEIFYKLVTALEVSADYLLGLVDYPNSIISDQVDQDTKEEIELIRRA
ncbi:MAG: helix-turn-helix domain-containing protein, partial [Peptococcaceae bacterium]|nr:helix-turn-helix domain-containing protein [Peptococcaceae bacterium]